MANVKISDMTPGTAPTGAELLEAVQGGGTVSLTASQIAYAARKYGSFCDVTDQTGNTGTPTAVEFGTNIVNTAGVTVANNGSSRPTRVTYATAGTYMFAPNLQFRNSDAADHDVTIWLRKNGTDITNSATKITVPKTGDGGNAFFQIVFYETVTASQYLEVMWVPENVSVTLDFTAAAAGPPAIPAIPSTIVVTERIA